MDFNVRVKNRRINNLSDKAKQYINNKYVLINYYNIKYKTCVIT